MTGVWDGDGPVEGGQGIVGGIELREGDIANVIVDRIVHLIKFMNLGDRTTYQM